jgi:hypothetical protein
MSDPSTTVQTQCHADGDFELEQKQEVYAGDSDTMPGLCSASDSTPDTTDDDADPVIYALDDDVDELFIGYPIPRTYIAYHRHWPCDRRTTMNLSNVSDPDSTPPLDEADPVIVAAHALDEITSAV